MNLAGKRVGDCDAGEAKKAQDAQVARVKQQVAEGERMAADAHARACMSVAEGADLRSLTMQMENGMCKDAKYKVAFCESIKKCDVFKKLLELEKSQPEYGLKAAAKFCGVDVAGLKTACCDEAVKNEDLEFIEAQCPGKARDFALAKCAGLGYSALMGGKWQEFCTTYAKEIMEKGH